MKWDNLTMSQKQALMKIYVNNGVTNLDEIRNHYNRFDDGGEKDNITRQEYLQSKANEIKKQALEYSQSRVSPAVPLFDNPQSKEEFNKIKEERINYWTQVVKDIQKKKTKNPIFNEDFAKSNLEAVKKETYCPTVNGASCIYTATDNYSQDGIDRRVSGNLSFESSPNKYGFIPINKELLSPGDLVQSLTGTNPTHAMIFDSYNENGEPLYNYSRGGNQDADIVKKGKYPLENNALYYTFVGTPEDQHRWSLEYLDKYIKPNLKMAGLDNISPISESLVDNIDLNIPINYSFTKDEPNKSKKNKK